MKIELSEEEIAAILKDHFAHVLPHPLQVRLIEWRTWPNTHVAIELEREEKHHVPLDTPPSCPLPDNEIPF